MAIGPKKKATTTKTTTTAKTEGGKILEKLGLASVLTIAMNKEDYNSDFIESVRWNSEHGDNEADLIGAAGDVDYVVVYKAVKVIRTNKTREDLKV
jgi:hypothetical protein